MTQSDPIDGRKSALLLRQRFFERESQVISKILVDLRPSTGLIGYCCLEMTDGSVLIRVSDGGVSFRVRVKPGARRDRLVGAYGGALKLEVSAAPERGKANSAVKKLLAKTLDVPQSAIEILSGETSQDKSI